MGVAMNYGRAVDLNAKADLIKKFDKYFPLNSARIPKEMLGDINKLYKSTTNHEAIINTLNNTYFRMQKWKTIKRSEQLGFEVEDRSGCNIRNMTRLYGYRARS